MCQSTNDVTPSAIHIATIIECHKKLLPALDNLLKTLNNKSEEYKDIVKVGRTHAQDAVPLTLGQEFSAWAKQIKYGIDRIKGTFPRLLQLALGGTAVGTGLNSYEVNFCRYIKIKGAI